MKFRVMTSSRPLSPFWYKVIAVSLLPFLALWLWLAWHMDAPVLQAP